MHIKIYLFFFFVLLSDDLLSQKAFRKPRHSTKPNMFQLDQIKRKYGMFIHFGIAHLLFNMLWLLDLGTMIERRQGTLILSTLVLVLAALSNLGQYLWVGPDFGGMSGVVYGLLGYIWLRGKFDPGSGLFLNSSTVTMAVAWYVLCLVGVIPHVANAAHSVGFGVGIVWGYVSALTARRHR